jgi:sugar lactone lactonase YvrE
MDSREVSAMRRYGWVAALLLAARPAAAQDMPLTQVLLPGEGWQAVEGEHQSAASLAGDREGNVYIADPKGKQILRIAPTGGKPAHLLRTGAAVHGLGLGPTGTLYACQPEARRLVKIDGEEKVLAEGLAVQDVAVTAGGDCYCTVPAEKAVYFIGDDGTRRRVDTGIAAPAGITFWADQGTLVVGDAEGKRLYAFRVERDGGLTAKEGYYTLRVRPGQDSGVARLTIDGDRRVYAATPEGVQVFDPTGRLCGVLLKPLPEPVTAVAFGGAERDRLYIACGSKLFVRKMKARGFGSSQTPKR